MINVCVLILSTGSAEGFNKADRDINTAVKSGRWVMFFCVCVLSMYTLFRCTGVLTVSVPQVGDVRERPPGPRMADAAGEEAPLHAASFQLQAFPDNGDQPQGKPLHILKS